MHPSLTAQQQSELEMRLQRWGLVIALAVTCLLFAVPAFSAAAARKMLGGVDLAAPVQYTEQLNEDGEPFDPYYKAEEEAEDAVVEAVCPKLNKKKFSIKNFNAYTDCGVDVFKRFRRAGRFRGTREFVRLNYAQMDRKQLRARAAELEGYVAAADSYIGSKKPPGVLEYRDLRTEIDEILYIIAKRNRAQLIAECEEIFGKGHSRCILR